MRRIAPFNVFSLSGLPRWVVVRGASAPTRSAAMSCLARPVVAMAYRKIGPQTYGSAADPAQVDSVSDAFFVLVLASDSARRFAAGSMPSANARRASSRFSRARFKETSGYAPRVSSFSTPPTRYLKRHSCQPAVVTSMNSPRSSCSL